MDSHWDFRFLEGLGNAYNALGIYDQATNYRQQWKKLAQDLEDKQEEGKAVCSLGINLDSFPSSLVLAALNIDQNQIKSIKPRRQRRHYRAVVNWLINTYQPKDSSQFDKLRVLLEAFHHFCEVEAWSEARDIIIIRLDTPTNQECHEQLRNWGFYLETNNLYMRLLGKLDSQWEAIFSTGIGEIYNDLGNFHEALRYFQNSFGIAKYIGNLRTKGNILRNLGKTYHFLNNYHDAIQAHIESLNIAKNMGNRMGEGFVMSDLGITYNAIQENKKSLYYLQKSLDIAQSTNNKLGQAIALEGLGIFSLRQNNYEQTVEHSQQQLTIAREIGYRKSEATALRNLGKAQTYCLEPSKALENLQSALGISREIGDHYNEAICRYYLSQKYHEDGYTEEAKLLASQALLFSQSLNISLEGVA